MCSVVSLLVRPLWCLWALWFMAGLTEGSIGVVNVIVSVRLWMQFTVGKLGSRINKRNNE